MGAVRYCACHNGHKTAGGRALAAPVPLGTARRQLALKFAPWSQPGPKDRPPPSRLTTPTCNDLNVDHQALWGVVELKDHRPGLWQQQQLHKTTPQHRRRHRTN
jgi:hypothetical protein